MTVNGMSSSTGIGKVLNKQNPRFVEIPKLLWVGVGDGGTWVAGGGWGREETDAGFKSSRNSVR